MELELSKKQFRRLLDLVYIGNWILNSTRGDERFADYDQVESLVFAKAALEGRPIPPLPPLSERCDTAVRQFELAAAAKGERVAVLEARRHYCWYLKGVPHSGYYKEQIVQMNTLEDVYRVTKGIKRDLT